MGHSQFAEYIGARGPNTAVNAACATTTHAISIAEDWIRNGRCQRVVIVAGDDVTGGSLVSWVGTGLLASGATTTEGDLENAALPFDRRRNGMIMGMGAAALVVESEDSVRERGMKGICEILSTDTANSAYHGTRLDINHVSRIMQRVIEVAEKRFGIDKHKIASQTMFMSHETYTPARGGSAAAEIEALKSTFSTDADQILIANTKGYTGHTMGVGIEDVVAVKALEYGIVPPIANINHDFEPDPNLGNLNLSKGGTADIQYALRLGAGFGSQVAMILLRKIPDTKNRVNHSAYKQWLAAVSGNLKPEIEIKNHTLRIVDKGVPTDKPAPSKWVYGHGPSLWAAVAKQKAVSVTELEPENASMPKTSPVAIPTEEEIKMFLLNLVSEKTGYPVEILEMDLDLEADLGIDTVKQAELFSAVRENYNIPRREDLMLVEYNTLQKVVKFVQNSIETEMQSPSSPELSKTPTPDLIPATNVNGGKITQTLPPEDEIKEFLLNLVSEKTGYPVEILELDLDLEADLGIDTVKQAELFSAVRENYNIPRREDLMLVEYNTLEKVIGFVQDSFEGYQPQSDIVSQPAPESEPLVVSREEPSQQPTRDEIKNFLLALVSEKTGYPVEILELDLDLEADLGIDTVKQAELFSAVRENYNIPRREDLMLVEYNTLEKVISFVQDSLDEINQISYRPENDETLEVFPQILEQPANIGADDFVPQSIMRRVPVPLLRPRHDLCKPTGVVFNKDSRVMVIEDETGIADELIDLLLEYKVKVFKLKTRDLDQQVHTISTWLEDGAFNGIFFLASLNQESPLKNMATKDWETLLKENVYALFRIMQTLPENVFLVCATNIGGLHGINQPEIYATGGGVSGFCKALATERPSGG